MKIILTSQPKEIVSKKGANLVFLNGLSSKGASLKFMVRAEDYQSSGVSSKNVLPKEALEALFAEVPSVDVDYDETGFVQSLSV